MRLLRGLFFIGLAIFCGLFLIVGWDFLGDYYLTLRVLPDTPLFGARVAFGIAIIVFVVSAANNLVRRKAAEADLEAQR